MKNYTERLKEVFAVLFMGPDYGEEKIREYFSEDYVQHVDGKVLNFEQFVKHLQVVREVQADLRFEFKTVIAEGNVVFSNHVVNGMAHVIGEFRFNEAGKVCYCDELTRVEHEEMKDIGSRH